MTPLKFEAPGHGKGQAVKISLGLANICAKMGLHLGGACKGICAQVICIWGFGGHAVGIFVCLVICIRGCPLECAAEVMGVCTRSHLCPGLP